MKYHKLCQQPFLYVIKSIIDIFEIVFEHLYICGGSLQVCKYPYGDNLSIFVGELKNMIHITSEWYVENIKPILCPSSINYFLLKNTFLRIYMPLVFGFVLGVAVMLDPSTTDSINWGWVFCIDYTVTDPTNRYHCLSPY